MVYRARAPHLCCITLLSEQDVVEPQADIDIGGSHRIQLPLQLYQLTGIEERLILQKLLQRDRHLEEPLVLEGHL